MRAAWWRSCCGLLMILVMIPMESDAMTTELGVSYFRKKNTFDDMNYVDSESTTGTVSFYFLERLAFEFSYTKALAVRGEKAGATDLKRTSVQKTEVFGGDLIFVLVGNTATVQPYVKGGIAQINRSQEIKIDTLETQKLELPAAVVPSYGVGLKVKMTETLNLKISYDIWQTPISDTAKTDDSSLHVGVTWIL